MANHENDQSSLVNSEHNLQNPIASSIDLPATNIIPSQRPISHLNPLNWPFVKPFSRYGQNKTSQRYKNIHLLNEKIQSKAIVGSSSNTTRLEGQNINRVDHHVDYPQNVYKDYEKNLHDNFVRTPESSANATPSNSSLEPHTLNPNNWKNDPKNKHYELHNDTFVVVSNVKYAPNNNPLPPPEPMVPFLHQDYSSSQGSKPRSGVFGTKNTEYKLANWLRDEIPLRTKPTKTSGEIDNNELNSSNLSTYQKDKESNNSTFPKNTVGFSLREDNTLPTNATMQTSTQPFIPVYPASQNVKNEPRSKTPEKQHVTGFLADTSEVETASNITSTILTSILSNVHKYRDFSSDTSLNTLQTTGTSLPKQNVFRSNGQLTTEEGSLAQHHPHETRASLKPTAPKNDEIDNSKPKSSNFMHQKDEESLSSKYPGSTFGLSRTEYNSLATKATMQTTPNQSFIPVNPVGQSFQNESRSNIPETINDNGHLAGTSEVESENEKASNILTSILSNVKEYQTIYPSTSPITLRTESERFPNHDVFKKSSQLKTEEGSFIQKYLYDVSTKLEPTQQEPKGPANREQLFSKDLTFSATKSSNTNLENKTVSFDAKSLNEESECLESTRKENYSQDQKELAETNPLEVKIKTVASKTPRARQKPDRTSKGLPTQTKQPRILEETDDEEDGDAIKEAYHKYIDELINKLKDMGFYEKPGHNKKVAENNEDDDSGEEDYVNFEARKRNIEQYLTHDQDEPLNRETPVNVPGPYSRQMDQYEAYKFKNQFRCKPKKETNYVMQTESAVEPKPTASPGASTQDILNKLGYSEPLNEASQPSSSNYNEQNILTNHRDTAYNQSMLTSKHFESNYSSRPVGYLNKPSSPWVRNVKPFSKRTGPNVRPMVPPYTVMNETMNNYRQNIPKYSKYPFTKAHTSNLEMGFMKYQGSGSSGAEQDSSGFVEPNDPSINPKLTVPIYSTQPKEPTTYTGTAGYNWPTIQKTEVQETEEDQLPVYTKPSTNADVNEEIKDAVYKYVRFIKNKFLRKRRKYESRIMDDLYDVGKTVIENHQHPLVDEDETNRISDEMTQELIESPVSADDFRDKHDEDEDGYDDGLM